jgi:lactate dehydrogenase-like 2-hydroxyacid dehydrogenase
MQDAEIIFVDQFICPLSNEILDEAKGLKLIIMNTTSYHLIDIDYLKKRNIILCNTPDFCSSSVAELVFLYTLSLARKTNLALQDNMDAPFEIYPDDMNHRKYVGYNLENKTI